MSQMSRLVLMFPGFEPIPIEAHRRRFLREAAKTAPVYGMTIEPVAFAAEERSQTHRHRQLSRWRRRRGAGRPTEGGHLRLGELTGLCGAHLVRRAVGGRRVCRFRRQWAFFRYLSISWRLRFFFIFPLLVLIGAALAAWIAYLAGAALVAAAPALCRLSRGACASCWCFVYAARRLHFLLVMDDWVFARDLARGAPTGPGRRLMLLAADVRRRIDRSAAEEIVFAAHSFGAVAAVMMLAATPDGRAGPRRHGLMTVGSSLLKIALHPAAKSLRAAVETIVEADGPWLDVQSLTDILNFYGSKPAELLAGRSGANQNTTKVRFRSQLDPATYRAIKRDFFRVHRQFVFGVERRSHYSYHAILCGPEPFAEVARRGGLLDD